MKKVYRWIISLLFSCTSIVAVQGSRFIPVDEKLQFGAKVGYLFGSYALEDRFSCVTPELFMTYHFNTIDKGPRYPLFGFWGSRYECFAIQLGICCKSINVHLGRWNIDPQATFFLYKEQEIGSVYFSLKALSIPISFKSYIDKNRKFCIIAPLVAPLFILSVYKKDWIAELANEPGQELLRRKIYKNNSDGKQDETGYDYRDPHHKRDRATFYNKWKNRKEKDKRTYLSASSLFGGIIGLEITFLAIEYETYNGFIFNWNMLNASFLGKRHMAISSIFSIGYKFSKLLHNDTYLTKKPEII